ncbi:MAG: FecR domain-containing protein [Treponema sp.]|nr:FecR domain-containing protein [Treponema sp.]
MKKNTKSTRIKPIGFVDCLVIIILLGIAAFSINVFRLDLLHTINLRNVEPIGTVVIRKNIVQRRLADRVIWDRLATESPVYLGDLIRVADLSAATLHIEGNSIDLNENTLIRITRAPDGESLQIIMSEGNISLAAAADSGKVSLDVNGRQVQVASGTILTVSKTVFNVKAAEDSMRLQVNEGVALYIEEGQAWEVHAGGQIAIDAGGFERDEKATVVIHPVSNARYINGNHRPYMVDFLWNKINLNTDELLRLEIAADRNFNYIFYINENLDNQVRVAIDNGLWYWRLSHANTVFGEGRFTILDGTGPRLQSPAVSSIFTFSNELPTIHFRWDAVDEATAYILEVCDTPYFMTPRIHRQSQTNSYTDSSLGVGTWYWQVTPVFSAVYTGHASFSPASYFTIERADFKPGTEHLDLAEWFVTEIPPELLYTPEPPLLLLSAPEPGARIEGLTALRQRTVFSWECEANIIQSRFVLSRNADPFQGTPAMEILNPGKTITVNRLGEGRWYWNIEAQTADGFTIRAAEHGIVYVLSVSLLPAAQNLQPARGYYFTMNDLQTHRNLGFRWQAVRGANAYIFTLVHQTERGSRQLIRTQPISRTTYALEDLRILDRGTFIWQVEAIYREANGAIVQRGTIAESTFVLDFLLPSTIHVEGSGIFE